VHTLSQQQSTLHSSDTLAVIVFVTANYYKFYFLVFYSFQFATTAVLRVLFLKVFRKLINYYSGQLVNYANSILSVKIWSSVTTIQVTGQALVKGEQLVI
jgi:hypothetical protein